MDKNKIDIKENYIYKLSNELLEILLKDRSSKKNIIWATDNYEYRGVGYRTNDQIMIPYITGYSGGVIKPRVEKSKKEQTSRVRDKAEVFTPSWICNQQNNLVDSAWFGYENVFNTETENGWISTTKKIDFTVSNKAWQDYVKACRMEVSCGEAPYLVSRYDTVTGEAIPISQRIGLLDRKLRVVSENTTSEKEWVEWAFEAFKSVYGFDWQGDNVLLARENLLFTFQDYYIDKFVVPPVVEYLTEIATIVSWNIWQMDGLKYVIPNSCKPELSAQISMFDEQVMEECQGCSKGNNKIHNGIYCYIKDWQKNKKVKFVSLLKEG